MGCLIPHALYTALLIVLSGLAQTAELRVAPSFPPVQSEQDIRTVIGSEAETRGIIH